MLSVLAHCLHAELICLPITALICSKMGHTSTLDAHSSRSTFLTSKKIINIAIKLDLIWCAFFSLGGNGFSSTWTDILCKDHTRRSRFHYVTTFSEKLCPNSKCSKVHAQTHFRYAFWPGVRICGTIQAQIFVMLRSVFSIYLSIVFSLFINIHYFCHHYDTEFKVILNNVIHFFNLQFLIHMDILAFHHLQHPLDLS